MLVITRKIGEAVVLVPQFGRTITIIPVKIEPPYIDLLVIAPSYKSNPRFAPFDLAEPGIGFVQLTDTATNSRIRFEYAGNIVEVCINRVLTRTRVSIGIDASRDWQVLRCNPPRPATLRVPANDTSSVDRD